MYYFEDPPWEMGPSSSLLVSVLPNFELFTFSFRTLNLRHARLGCVNFKYLCLFFSLLSNACKTFKFHCEVCELSKHARSSYIPCMHHCDSAFSLIHFDVWRPSLIVALSGHRYYVTFIYDYSRYIWVYMLKRKSKVLLSLLLFYK